MALHNRFWGAYRIRGELLKLGIQAAKRTIQRYMRVERSGRPAGQMWSTFLRTHAQAIWACVSGISMNFPFVMRLPCDLRHRASFFSDLLSVRGFRLNVVEAKLSPNCIALCFIHNHLQSNNNLGWT